MQCLPQTSDITLSPELGTPFRRSGVSDREEDHAARGNSSSERMLRFTCKSAICSTLFLVTSEPVPAVVGTQTTGNAGTTNGRGGLGSPSR